MRRHAAGLAGLAVSLLLAACGSPAPSSPAATASVTHELFRLNLTVDRTIWKSGDLITGTAALTNTGAAPVEAYGSGMGPVVFVFTEVGGSRQLGNVMTADCSGRELPAGTPLATQLHANGAHGGDSADAWISSANDEHGAKLPAGTWDITARADFVVGGLCKGTAVLLQATARVTVLP